MSRGTRRGRPAKLAAIAIVALTPFAAPAFAARGQTLTLTTQWSSTYDNNLLQYSEDQIGVFESGTRPARFSIKTRDDVAFEPSVALGWELDQGHGRRHGLRIKGEGDFHDKNGTADHRSLSVGWRESFRGDRRFSAGYYLLPNYYLRQLLDEDLPATTLPSRYRRATFRLQIATAGWDQRLGRNTRLSLDYQFEGRRYNPEFAERTSKLHQGTAGLGWDRLPRHGSVELRGGYRKSRADASDGDEAPGAAPDDQDVSYHGVIAGLGGRVEFARHGQWRVLGDAGYEFEARDFDSDRAFDTTHNGRKDRLHVIELGLRAAYRPHWSARSFFRYERNRAAFSGATAPSTDPGSYSVRQVGLAIEWTGQLWSRSKGAAPGAEGD